MVETLAFLLIRLAEICFPIQFRHASCPHAPVLAASVAGICSKSYISCRPRHGIATTRVAIDILSLPPGKIHDAHMCTMTMTFEVSCTATYVATPHPLLHSRTFHGFTCTEYIARTYWQ